jgi:cobalt/nickel transport system permease protein
MNISEGFLDIRYCIGGYAVAAGLVGWSLKRLKQPDIPKISVMGAAFFVSSLIHFKIGITSLHLTLIGLMGLFLGPHVVLAILTGLFFQAIMFQHGGLSTLGLNTVAMSLPALFIQYIFGFFRKKWPKKVVLLSVVGASLSGVAVFLASLIVTGMILLTDDGLTGVAWGFQLAYAALALAEGVLSFFILLQVLRTNPLLLAGSGVQ